MSYPVHVDSDVLGLVDELFERGATAVSMTMSEDGNITSLSIQRETAAAVAAIPEPTQAGESKAQNPQAAEAPKGRSVGGLVPRGPISSD
jgi:hypothetical protein